MIATPKSPQEGLVNVKRLHKVRARVLSDASFVYTVTVSPGDKEHSWEVRKRHGSFEKLQNELLKQGFFVPLIPHKRNVTSDPSDPAFVERKRKYLAAWLKELFASDDIRHSLDFKRFFQDKKEEEEGLQTPKKAKKSSSSNINSSSSSSSSGTSASSSSVSSAPLVEPETELESAAQALQGMLLGVQDSPAGHGEFLATVEETETGSSPPHGSPATSAAEDRRFKGAPSVARLKDFNLLKVIGKGSFGKVMLVLKKDDNRIYAMKVLHKDSVIKRNQVEHTQTERNVLEYIRHPFIVTLRFAFQTKQKLYFVLDYCPGGELFFHLGRAGRFSENRGRFYAAQIVLALEYLHSKGIVYRDLKPENVLLDSEGHIALTDFGLSKEGIQDNVSAHSFCGTPEYLAPEILTREGHGRAADWWSLGALLFEMLTGMPPFYSRNRDRLFYKILKATLRIPKFFSPAAKDLMNGLLSRDPSARLGSEHDGVEIKSHPFFESIDWDKLVKKEITPPFKPLVPGLTDTRNFDQEFTSMALDSVDEGSSLRNSVASVSEGKFAGFTFVNSDKLS
jgi:serine/threonine protein kinase